MRRVWSASCAPRTTSPGWRSTPPTCSPRWSTRPVRRPGSERRGSVSVAPTKERFEELKRGASMARVFGSRSTSSPPPTFKDLVPLAHVDDLVGGVHLPGDGVTNPIDTTQALAKGARARGVRIVENVKVERILTESKVAPSVSSPRSARSVPTPWSTRQACGHAESGDQVGAVVPLHAAEHFYIVTEAHRRESRRRCRCCATRTAAATSRRKPASCWSVGSSRSPNRGA